MPHTILLVEDEYATLEVLTLLFERAGYQVLTASDGEEGLVRLHERRPDIVLTDFWMPRLDGGEFCQRMQEDERWRGIPVIMMTAAHGPKTPVFPGVVAVFAKPLLFDELLSTVERVLGEQA